MRREIRLSLLFLIAGCTTNEYTGRKQLMLVDEATERELGASAYQQTLGESRVSSDSAETEPLRRVGRRISEAAAKPDFRWEFNVIVDDKTMNAWCLPGGKIAFYTGIFPVLQDEAGMAFVMGHEVSHALLHHGGERMSQTMAAQGAATLLGAFLGTKDPAVQQSVLAAFGAATQVGVLLPFSRKHESEADRLGLELMAKAGYDPRVSVEVWKRMSALGGGQPPQWLSTHPSHETRIKDLEAHMAEAEELYRRSSPASIAKLPRVGGREGKGGQVGAAFAPGGGSAQAQPEGARRTKGPDGSYVLQFDVRFDRDVFVRSIEIQGPGGLHQELRVDSGVPAKQKRSVLLKPEDTKAGGTWTLAFQGSESGHPFRSSASYDLP